MDNFDPPFIKYSWDGQSNCRFRYSVSLLDGQNYYDQELNIAVETICRPDMSSENPIPDSNPDKSRWELLITGKPSNDFREELNRRLTSEGVSLAIRNEVVPFIYNTVASCEVVELCVIIDILIDDHEDEDEDELEIDEELDMVIALSMEDYSKASSASREVVEALEKVMIRGEERETGCAVCLEEFELGFEATKTPCSHVFHGDCIGSWLENRCVCPLCRYELSYVEETN